MRSHKLDEGTCLMDSLLETKAAALCICAESSCMITDLLLYNHATAQTTSIKLIRRPVGTQAPATSTKLNVG